jgi:hypothetical protein
VPYAVLNPDPRQLAPPPVITGYRRERQEQGRGRNAESGGEGDEVVYVASAAGAFGAAEGGVGHRTAQRGAAGGELVLGQAAHEA